MRRQDRNLVEGGLFEGLGASLHHGVERLQHSKHALHVALSKVKAGSFLQALVPHFMPQDSHPDEFLTDLDERRTAGVLGFESSISIGRNSRSDSQPMLMLRGAGQMRITIMAC